MKQIILTVIMQHVRDIQGIRPSQHRFMNGRFCLTSLTSFYGQVSCLVDNVVDVVCLVFSKAFDTVSCSNLLQKLAAMSWSGALFTGKELTGGPNLENSGEWSKIRLVFGHG